MIILVYTVLMQWRRRVGESGRIISEQLARPEGPQPGPEEPKWSKVLGVGAVSPSPPVRGSAGVL